MSKTITLARPTASRASRPLISTPLCAAVVIPETIETGVDMASAQGQAMTSRTSAL